MKCFLIEQTDVRRVTASTTWGTCPKDPWAAYGKPEHRAQIIRFEGPAQQARERYEDKDLVWTPFHAVCNYCGEDGGIQATTSTGMHSIWRRADTGETRDRPDDFGVGAMYYADWECSERPLDAQGRKLWGWDWDNQFEPPLYVITPGGPWCIDSRASNCTLKEDRMHRCWVRHGTPPNIHVDKAGVTCRAGAGSIICGKYHGFLHGGSLTNSL